jgi:hypothetical protein
MTKVALVLAIVAIGEGAVTLHLVNRLHEERESAQTLQARVTELERKVPQAAAGATFIAVPTQPTVSPFSVAKTDGAPGSPPPQAIAGVITASDGNVASRAMPVAAPDQERMREQIKQSIERQAALLRDPEYRDAMLAQQKVGLRQGSPNLARDLDLTPEQADRLFTTLAEQQLRSMESASPMMWGEQPDPAQMQEYQRKAMEQQRANDTELKRVLGEAKYREYQEYQSLSGVRWEADRVRTALANAGVPLEENLTKPLLKTLQEQQQKMMQQMASAAAAAGAQGSFMAVTGAAGAMVTTSDGTNVNMIEMQEKSLEFQAQQQKRQREALAHVLTPEQLKVIEDEHKTQLQMQRAQIKMMRAQQEAGLLDQSGNSVGYIQEQAVTFTPPASD